MGIFKPSIIVMETNFQIQSFKIYNDVIKWNYNTCEINLVIIRAIVKSYNTSSKFTRCCTIALHVCPKKIKIQNKMHQV